MYRIILVVLLLSSLNLIGQESLEPLGSNPTLIRSNRGIDRTIDQTYIYAIDTIHLPFKDDFSRDRFKKFDAKPTDANVSDTMFYKILNAGVRDVDTAAFMLDTTYNYRYTPTVTADSFQIDTIPLPSMGFRTVCDLDAYPVTCVTVEVWPPYNTDDTVGTVASPDNIYNVIPPDLVQDSALVYFVKATDTLSLWQDNFAYLNDDYAINPPTIGVATFDGLNENGYPYDFSTAFTYGKADYLTSKPIFLDQNAAGTPYGIVDSLYLSFFYQAQGLGNEPEKEDSLVVQFWSPNDNKWFSVWRTDTVIVDSNFRTAMIPIRDAKYLKAGFKFRFLNYSSLSGSFDHWHVDYVFLNTFRIAADTSRDDVSFQLPTHTLLKDYTAMPWKHFKWDPLNSMLDSVFVFQRNNNVGAGRLVGSNNLDISYKGVLQQTINNPNTPSVNGSTNFITPYDIPSAYHYDTAVNDTNATFNIEVRHNTTPDFCRINDTLRFNQEFSDYYSYDDGTAEAAYGVQGLGGLNPKIASQFKLLNGDTIKSVFIHFTPSAYNMSSSSFVITIWNDNAGKPGSVIYEKVTLDVPRYNLGVNGFYEYPMDSNHYLNAGTYYIGWAQTTVDRINVGFDKNIDNANHTFYNSNGLWRNTGFKGTLMVRPSFVYQRDYSVGLNEFSVEKVSVYPNPTSTFINLQLQEEILDYNLTILDLTGKTVYKGIASRKIDVSNYQQGVYLLKLVNKTTGNLKVAKFVKSNH